MNYSWEIAKMIFYLSLILGAIYLLANFLKKKVFQPASGKYLKTIEQLYLGPKKSLKLVKVKEEILLLSITEEEIVLLKEWPETEFPPMIEEENKNKKDFSQHLKSFIDQYRRGQDE